MRQIASLIAAAVHSDPATTAGAARLAEVAAEVSDLVQRFPAYPMGVRPREFAGRL